MTSSPCSLRLARVLFIGLALAPVASAVQPHATAGASAEALAQLGELPRISPAIDADESKQWAATNPEFRAFVAEAGIEWSARWDRRTGHLSFASGSFPAWLPADHRVREADEIAATRELLEQQARALMARHPDLLGLPPSARLVLDGTRSVPVDDGRIWQLDFRVELAGVPVTGAHVSFRLNSGRLVQLSQQGIADVLEVAETQPRLTAQNVAAQSTSDLVALLGASAEVVSVAGEPGLELIPVADDPFHFSGLAGDMQYRLAWRTTARVAGAPETWVALIDAITGQRLFVWDSNRYACPPTTVPQGHVVGGIYTGPIETTAETVHGFPCAAVNNGGPVIADINGTFPYNVGSPASTSLSGEFFDLDCAACSNPGQALAQIGSPGLLSLGVGGNNTIGNGFSTKAERNCFYHLNVTRQIAAKHLSDAATGGFLTRQMPATVNIGNACNAFYDGVGVNFFQFGGGCNNTGEIADVMQHEWGHGLDDNTGGINDGGMSEGVGDVTAFLATHNPIMSPFFVVGDPNGIRNADEVVAGVRTWAQVDTLCGGREVHCVGEIFTQPWWHLGRLLRARAVAAGGSEAAGWFLLERLFYQHLPLADTMDPAGANNMYDAITLVDDDDGNPANGVPDGTEINAAFSHHAFVSPPAVLDSADCAPPVTPTVTLNPVLDPGTGSWQIAISWTAVTGAVEYRVARNETGGNGGDVDIATVIAPATSFRDDWVTNGTTYRYRVTAFLANGCFSIGENVQSTTIPDQFAVTLDTAFVDDGAGNANGAAEPGETLTLVVTATNASSVSATNVMATLTTTHPGVTLVQDTCSLGNMTPGATVTTSPPHFVITLDASLVSCPDTVPLAFSFEAPEGCSNVSFNLAVGPAPRIDDLEIDRGWTVNAAGTDTATTGDWERAVPNGRNASVAEDHTPAPGTQCFVTGNGFDPGGNDGFDDVDGGCTTLLSPVYDFGGLTGLTLSYWRDFTIQVAMDDQLVVEISNDAGGNWSPLESVATSTPTWTEARFPLDAVLGGPANQVRLRFTACDTGQGSLIETAVDDVAFTGFPCEDPFPRPRLIVTRLVVGDDATSGGTGNGDGILDPGETVRFPMDLRNGGGADATAVAGTLTIVGGSAGVTDPSVPWSDIAIAQVETSAGAPPHFEIAVAQNATCGSTVDLVADVTYDGPGGSYSLRHPFSLMIGRYLETVVFEDGFEGAGDNGVTHGLGVAGNNGCSFGGTCNDDWQHGALPSPSGYDPPDTLAPGGSVWGNDLFNQNGNFENDCCSYLEFPPIDCTGVTGLRLAFLRWLTAAGPGSMQPPIPGDQARLMVRRQADAGFTTVWEKVQGDDLLDIAWTPVEYDISAVADGDPGLVIRFEIQTDARRQRGGWNIDDLKVYSQTTECHPLGGCGAPPIPPATGPVLRATPNYDGNGAEYSWIGAPIGATDEFRLYRGVLPMALGTIVTPPGHVATSYNDRLAPGRLYFYRLVLANCLDQEGPATP